MNNYIRNIEEQQIKIENDVFRKDQLSSILWSNPDSHALSSLVCFLEEWFNEEPAIAVNTSGSTGLPKLIHLRKEYLVNSACMTCDFLELQPDDTAILCMSLDYIGAKMMVVRALVASLNLIVAEPSGHPLEHISGKMTFAAMVPLQVFNSFSTEKEKIRLSGIEKLIIGGGPVSKELERKIRLLPNPVYSTYGMTETISHIAMKRLNGKDNDGHYHPMPGVTVSLAEENVLQIEAPFLMDEPLITNDIGEVFTDGSFVVKGRKDLVINTGGIKIFTEELEEKIRSVIHTPIAVTSLPDEKFGEVIVLLSVAPFTKMEEQMLREQLNRYEYPKRILLVEDIPLAGNGKTDRSVCRIMASRS